MPYCVQIIAGRHLAAEAVAAELDGHFRRGIRRGLHQHGNVQIGQAQRIGDGALLAEIRQGDDHAVDAVAVGAKQIGAFARFHARFHRAVFAFLGTEHQRLNARGRERLDDLLASFFGEMVGKEASVPDNNSHGHWSCHENNLARRAGGALV